ncbi:Deoxynucleoside triphosphate triphosphohydrolase SAMHD1 [Intoshia linei]|uniref:Deoxynucleoside triphosphate triphosphohydrolase SAMHD1 n=1 Tax=Intoshia linei TaxID=1819745 RepID=A0A177B2R3_9BILA|nr:Deoxynucleoside triphosphate triphosphohydrolase SAMHD1 [Intoshia linei]
MESKIFKDPLYGTIELHPLCVSIIDTPQFQRLHRIKQLGCGFMVFHCANHTRFEHCIGTSYLAHLMIKTIKENQPEVGITNIDILCVEIAALCHDLGHGPFSHLFENITPKHWKHEMNSIKLLKYILESNEKVIEMKDRYQITERDVTFICEMINPPKQIIGRDKNKHFMYEIVSNSINGIDVDKFDYIMRDSHYVGLSTGMCEAFKLAKDYIYYSNKKGEKVTIIEGLDDPFVFTQMNDSIYDMIRWSPDERILPARRILEKIENRSIYKYVCEWLIKYPFDKEEIKSKIIKECNSKEINNENVIIITVHYDYGKGHQNPIENINFYSKLNPDKVFKISRKEISTILPQNYRDSKGMVYLKNNALLNIDKIVNSTYCKMLKDKFTSMRRNSTIVNLDPAAENMPYTPDVDIRDFITVEEMLKDENLELGPNGALTCCMEYISLNMEWLYDIIGDKDADYLIIDCPGQIEIYTHLPIMQRIIQWFSDKSIRICGIFLLDSQFIIDESKYISGLLCSMSAMSMLPIPYLNVLSKGDLINQKFKDRIDEYLIGDTSSMLEISKDTKYNKLHHKFHRCLSEMMENLGSPRFNLIDIRDVDTLDEIITQVDMNLQYYDEVEHFDTDKYE